MSENLRSLFLLVEPNSITDAFLVLMIALFLMSIVFHIKDYRREFLEFAPSLLTSLGILGTFTGIIIGLFDFSINEIDSSIANLLEGLKTAFITSIVGILLSILLKTSLYFIPIANSNNDDIIDIDHLYDAMQEQTRVTEHLSQIIQATQSQQNQQLSDFQSSFAQSCSETMVSELNSIVSQFNTTIAHQFGENFKTFGDRFELFGSMVDRVSQEFEVHESRIKIWAERYDHLIENLGQISTVVSQLEDNLSNIPTYLSAIEPVMNKGQEQINGLNKQLEHYGAISDKFESLIPSMGNNLESFMQGMDKIKALITDDTHQLLEQYHQNLASAQNAIMEPMQVWQEDISQVQSQLNSSIRNLQEGHRDSHSSIINQGESLALHVQSITNELKQFGNLDKNLVNKLVTSSITSHRESMQDLAIQQAKTHQEMTDSLTQIITESLKKSDIAVSEKLSLIENHMDREIDEVMRAMGQALATISGQFTRDYQQLIQQMQYSLDRNAEVQS